MILLLAFPVGHAWCVLNPWHNLKAISRGLAIWQMECECCGRLWAYKAHGDHKGSLLPWDGDFEQIKNGNGWSLESITAGMGKRRDASKERTDGQ